MKKRISKVFSVALALCLVLAMAVPTFAAENIQTLNENTTSGNATVWYETDRNTDPDPTEPPVDNVNDNYTVTIPEYILATKDTSALNEYEVKAEEVLLHPGTQLEVSCAYDGEMIHDDSAETILTYKMQNAQADFATGDVILTVLAGDPFTASSTNVCAVLTMAPLFAGVYQGTVTFTCAVVETA